MKYVIVLVFCVFMGMTAISMGVGAAYPPLNQIAQPFVCAGGEMKARQKVTHTAPGTTYTQANWSCVSSSGKAEPISTGSIALYSGTFYGLILFAPIALLMALSKGGNATRRSNALTP